MPVSAVFWGEIDFVVDGTERITTTPPSPFLQTSFLKAVQTAYNFSRAPGGHGSFSEGLKALEAA
jgi:hypothetical protein